MKHRDQKLNKHCIEDAAQLNLKYQNDLRGADLATSLIGDQQQKRISRNTDERVLSILVWVYFIQILDKSVLGYGAVFGLRQDCNLTVSFELAIAQLSWWSFPTWLIFKVPHRILVPCLVLGRELLRPVYHNYAGLMATRFLRGFFEAGCLALFSVITFQWYRRTEQPMRAARSCHNVCCSVSYGLGQINGVIHSWQILFIFDRLATVLTAPVLYMFLNNSIPTARFLADHEKLQAIERLRANQTGTYSRGIKWGQAFEALYELKS
ncbi:uncharacterized protein LY79DRAFT_589510 [Colletotrichum navitas]|uniref:Uncharacterized protein n=1 Tax=Colletotrichum navitas TaxID=681940 RepID=A0AAD8Q1X1_9PEZI|nr:uncharacterized protein LY79DRAFT_589510 [Colletotrichum navitas]KAK1593742.1 hypothetical protein LY79DRAFT_589510 [Colletotrichum navitas]